MRDTTAKGIRLSGGEETEVEAIVDTDLWERANAILNSNTKTTKPSVQLFSGIIFCFCDGKMIVPSNLAKYVCINCRHKIGTDDLEEIFATKLYDIDLEFGDETTSNNLSDHWPHFTTKEKRLIVEQIINKIIVGRDAIDIELSVAPNIFKTAAFGQRDEIGNTTGSNEPIIEASVHNISEPLLSESDAAKFLSISKMTLLRNRHAGNIGFFRVGFRVLYSKEKHLIPFLEQRETGKQN